MKNFMLSLSLSLASLLIALLAIEIGIRITLPHEKDHVIPGRLFEIGGNLGWRLKRDWKSIHDTRYFTATYETNSLGWRDIPRRKDKPDDVHRILQYGDSQVFGWGVSVDERFTNRLEEQTVNLQVWNLGVPGYGLDQQILAYEYDGADIEADEVIFLFPMLLCVAPRRTISLANPSPYSRLALVKNCS